MLHQLIGSSLRFAAFSPVSFAKLNSMRSVSGATDLTRAATERVIISATESHYLERIIAHGLSADHGARAATAPSCSDFTIDQIGGMVHARSYPPPRPYAYCSSRRSRSPGTGSVIDKNLTGRST